MSKIILDVEELTKLKNDFQDLQNTASEVSSDGYVSGNLFVDSVGGATSTLDMILEGLVNSGNQMNQIVISTSQFFTEVIDGFVLEDQDVGSSFNLNDSATTSVESPSSSSNGSKRKSNSGKVHGGGSRSF